MKNLFYVLYHGIFIALMARNYLVLSAECNFKNDKSKQQNLKETDNCVENKTNVTAIRLAQTGRAKILSLLTEQPKSVLLKIIEPNENLKFAAKLSKILLQNVKFETLVIFNLNKGLNLQFSLAESPVPLLIFNEKVNWQLRHHYNENILSVIILDLNHSAEYQLFHILKPTFRGLQLKKLLIIQMSALGEQDKELLNWLHLKGFWQSIVMDFKGNTLTLDFLTKTLITNLTLKEFLKGDIKWRDLKGFPITCSMATNPPRAFIHYDAEKGIVFKGFYGTVIRIFTEYYNASLKPFILSNIDYYTEMDCVKFIRNKKLDICGDALPYHEQYVITMPEEMAASYLMVPYDKPLPRFYYFLKPFQQSVWFVVTLSFFYKIITLSFIHRLQHGSWNCSLQILYAVVSVLYLPFQLTHIRAPYRGFLEIIMICVGFVVANWYLSVLSSLLFTRLYYREINSFQDLRTHNITIMVDEFEFYLLNSTVIDPIVRQQLKVVPGSVLLQHRRDLDPRYAYYSQYDKIDYYLHQQKFLQRPRLKVLLPAVNVFLGGMPMKPNWPFQQLLNKFYRHLLESGIGMRLYCESLEDGIHTGYLKFFPTEHHYVEPLSIEYFHWPAIVLAVGLIAALIAFLLELLVFKAKKLNKSLSF